MGAIFHTVPSAASLRAEDGGNRSLRNVGAKLRGVIFWKNVKFILYEYKLLLN